METKTSTKQDVDQLERVLLDGNVEPMYVSLSLLEEITNCFSDEHQIGSGGFAVVYKGIVGKGMIAVKKLSRTFDLPESKFHKEVECLVKAKHKNIVRFLGYCSETQGRIAEYQGKFVMSDVRNWLLCFEYVPNGSLDKYITDASRGLEWRDRFRIIRGICEGLLHLHKMHILHLDLKPSNILIDCGMVPKIADFGLSRCLDKDQSRVFTSNLYGSQGYMAPEFFRGEVAYATDIYSLGCIILEILTGVKGYPEDESVVDNWMNRLKGSDHWDVQLEQVRVCIKIGIECIDSDPKKRPTACNITNMLDEMGSTIETTIPSSSVGQQVSVLMEQYCQEKTTELTSDHPTKNIREQSEIEELVKYVGKLREEHRQKGQKKTLDYWSLWGAQDTKQNATTEDASISSSNSGVRYMFSKINIFKPEARRYYERNGGIVLEKIESVKLLKKEKIMPIVKEDNLIGKGYLGEVYMGLVDKVPVIVRKYTGVPKREKRQFPIEVIIQSQILHKNIVRFIGCCVEVKIPLFVYEFLNNDSLFDILHNNSKVPLDLARRLSIAAQIADGLAYMHSVSIVKHGNVKTTNILFDRNFVPKISQIGMSNTIVGDCEHTTIITDDMDYTSLFPKQTSYLTAGQEADIYNFGLVILEIFSRKKATLADYNGLLSSFTENFRKGKPTELFDKEIALTGDLALLENVAAIANECLCSYPGSRPKMIYVAERIAALKRSC